MNQPALIHITCTAGNNSAGFQVRGSVEWLREMEAWINYNAAFLFARLNHDPEFLAQGRQELMDAFQALATRQPYQGQLVTLKLYQEKPQ